MTARQARDATRNGKGVRVTQELEHGAARRKQVRIGRASGRGGGTLKQHVMWLAQKAPSPRRGGTLGY